MQILHSKNTLNRLPRILRSKRANSAQKIKILHSENSNFASSALTRANLQFHAATLKSKFQAKFRDRRVPEGLSNKEVRNVWLLLP